MRKYYALWVVALVGFIGNAQIVTIPDANFKAKLLAADTFNTIAKDLSGNYCKIDSNNDGNIQISEALAISYLAVNNSSINNLIGITYFTNLTYLNCNTNQITSLNFNNLSNLTKLYCQGNQLTSLPVNNLINLTNIDCSYNQFTSLDLNNLINLSYLDCYGNQLTSLDVHNFTNLIRLNCSENQLTTLDVSALQNLTDLSCWSNRFTSLNVSNLTQLINLNCDGSTGNSTLASLVLSNLPNLSVLYCNNNLLTSLNVGDLTNLTKLSCQHNQIASLDVSNLTLLTYLICNYNLLTTLDVSNQTNLITLDCSNNHLTTLFAKNGKNESINLGTNYQLAYICADDGQIVNIQNQLNNFGYINCQVNSYCTFAPGGTYYTIQGDNRYDENNNGCDALDLSVPRLRMAIVNGTVSGTLVPNYSGHYFYNLSAGTISLSPILENPTYFNVSPTTATINFPASSSPYIQDFCLTANGVHNDLEVMIMPYLSANPGFDSSYLISYKNNGTSTQSGSVNLSFNDALMDFVMANPNVSSQNVDNLSWTFENLKPFEERLIVVTLNINSPTEIPAVNAGDVLNYIASIVGAPDETPNDNSSTFNQIVTNSFDPNDKTCIEGTTITPSIVGQYAHYIIRFENDGTATAQNIVVKDLIDTAKFDINSLIPLRSSNSYTTRITNTNQVEFIFQNINLPYTAGSNSGYVAFKIKTKPTLVVGNSFSNTASIFFDYNAPIATNTATTTVALLGTQDFDFGSYLRVYPVPAKQVLNLETKASLLIKSIEIYNMLGQMVMAIPNAASVSSIDVSDLKTGTYFIKVNTDKGMANMKFSKE